jgi:hypothetical protein
LRELIVAWCWKPLRQSLTTLSILEEKNDKASIHSTRFLEAGCRIHRGNGPSH